jgi:uncharacterized protein (DUF885 family)
VLRVFQLGIIGSIVSTLLAWPAPSVFSSHSSPAMQMTQQKSETAAADFPALVNEYLTDLHSRHPSLAAASGIYAWNGQLEDYSSQGIASEIAAIKKFQSRLEKIPPLSLDLSQVFDYQIVASSIRSRLLELEQIKSYERNPQVYNDAISNGLLQIAMFEYAPLDSRLRHIIAKQKHVPRLVDSARDNVEGLPPVFHKVALDSFRGTLSFIEKDLPRVFAPVQDAKLQSEFKKSTRSAAQAIAKYIKRLEKTAPDSAIPFAIGKESYEAKLKYDEGIDVPLDTLLKIARREIQRTKEDFQRAAAEIDAKRDTGAVWAEVRGDHPKAGTLVQEAQKQLDTIARFLDEKQLVMLPEGPRPVVAETPAFMRWATASMWTPGPFEGRRLPASYLITDVDPEWTDRQKEEYLSLFNYPQLWSTTIHEVYPGHFVQGTLLRQVQSQARRTWALAPASFVEGWAHYAEQMMIEEGFGAGDPKMMMGHLADALLRLCRVVVGIRMHTDGMTVPQATRFFVENAFMGTTPAQIEAERAAFDPTCIVYSIGKLAILKLRDDYKRYRKDGYSLREFHDRLLSNGLAPIWVHRQMMMPGDRGKLIE